MQKSTFWILVVGLAAIILIGPVGHLFSFCEQGVWGGWFAGPRHFMGGPMFLFPIVMLIVVLIVIYRIFFGSDLNATGQNFRTNSRVQGAPESALDILKKRYGRGELSQTEYEQMKKDLQD